MKFCYGKNSFVKGFWRFGGFFRRYFWKVYDFGSGVFIRIIEFVMGVLFDVFSKNRFGGVLKEIEGSEIYCIGDSVDLEKSFF